MTKIFVYGTLKPGYPLYHNVEKYVVDREAACANGRMYSIGAFPGVKFDDYDEDRKVYGVVLTVEDAAVQTMDVIEGHPTFYRRRDIEVFYGNRTETVQSYEYQGGVDGFTLLEEGTWY